MLVIVLAACFRSDPEPAQAVPASEPDKPPNIVLVVLDTARGDHFSVHGYPRRTTPNLERLARDGVVYDHAHSVAPWTLPAHVTMLTGLLPGEHGAHWGAFDEDASLEEAVAQQIDLRQDAALLPVRLKTSGYATIGFSSNPWVGEHSDLALGFDAFLELWRPTSGADELYLDLPASYRGDPAIEKTATGASFALFKHKWETSGRPEPFFAFFNLMDAHFPYVRAPGPFENRFGGDPEILAWMRTIEGDDVEMAMTAGNSPVPLDALVPFYDTQLLYADHMLGGLLDWMRAQQVYEDSLIIVTSDHGEHLGEDGRFAHQLSVAEPVLHVPLVVKLPANARGGTRVDNPRISNLDVYATIAGAADLAPIPGHDTPSLDLAQEGADRDGLLAEHYYAEAYLRHLATLSETFSPDEHRRVRRALYSNRGKTILSDLEVVEGADGDTARTLVSQLDTSATATLRDADDDAERIESLKALGYVGD